MPKIITAKRKEGELEKAQNYVRSQILFPAGLLGLLSIVIGVIALVYQLIIGTYDVFTFAQSSALIVAGIVLGWGQTRYHKFILREYPEFFAARMKLSGQRGMPRVKKHTADIVLDHPGRSLVPLFYVLGIALLVGLSAWSFSTGSLDYMAAFSLPWAGFFWGKMFGWRGIVDPPTRNTKK